MTWACLRLYQQVEIWDEYAEHYVDKNIKYIIIFINFIITGISALASTVAS